MRKVLAQQCRITEPQLCTVVWFDRCLLLISPAELSHRVRRGNAGDVLSPREDQPHQTGWCVYANTLRRMCLHDVAS